VGWLRDGGAAVAVGRGEVADRLAADKEVLQLAGDDDVGGGGGDALVVDLVAADELVAGEGDFGGVVSDGEDGGEDAGVERGGVGALGAGSGAEVRTVRLDVGDEEATSPIPSTSTRPPTGSNPTPR